MASLGHDLPTTAGRIRAEAVASSPGNKRLFDQFYAELRRLAGFHLAKERPDHTLQPTALVHEAFLRLTCQSAALHQERAHFLSVASEMIRRILVDHARHKGTQKRGKGYRRLQLDEISIPEFGEEPVDVVELDAILAELRGLNVRQAQIVDLRFFAGLSVDETAGVLGVSISTVKGDWRIARAWLRVRLRRS